MNGGGEPKVPGTEVDLHTDISCRSAVSARILHPAARKLISRVFAAKGMTRAFSEAADESPAYLLRVI
jgi:hypothetical protein